MPLRSRPPIAAFAIDRSAGRRLRVGYVSADFRQHSVAWFAEPLLAAHDRTRIELFCYAAVATPDAVTERFRAIAEHWRNIDGLDDAAVAELVRQDGIDVLVDLTGHTAGSRLLVFARRPAPVQVEYLLGHGYTSGLATMDAFLADAMLAPPGADALFSERLIRLPRIPLAYAPPDAMPEVTPLPATANGFVTFGYFGRTERLNDAVIAAWARILRDVPGARLMLNNLPFRESAFRDLIAATVCRARRRSRPARADCDLAATRHLGGVWRYRHRARSIPAQCRHHHDRGTVAGGSRRLAGGATERRTLRRDDPARRRNGRLGQRRHRWLRRMRPRRGDRPAQARTGACHTAPACRRLRRCAMRRDWRGTSKPPIARCTTHAEHRIDPRAFRGSPTSRIRSAAAAS